MSNILWLTPEVPYPPVGGRNGVYHRIVQMSKYNTIHLLSIAYSDSEIEPAKSEMLKFCNTCNFYNRNVTKFKNYFKSLFMPYSVASRTSKVIVNDIINAVLENSIDIIIIEFPNMVLNVIKALKSKKLSGKHVIVSLNQHNIEYVRMRELYNVKNISYKKRIAYFLESFRLERYESKIYKTNIFDSITFFSADDVRYFGDRWDNISAQLKVFPLGVNLVKIESFEKKREAGYNILFVGRLDEIAVPNVEAALWFHNSVYPKILNILPQAKFIIAGANPSERIMSLAGKNVEVIPNYKKLEDVYPLADCVVLPLLSGGGVKGKLLEAAAFKKIIVSTTHGIEGTMFSDNVSVLLADSAEKFADACIEALTNSEKCATIIQNAYNILKDNYSWDSICNNYNEYLMSRVKN